MKPVEEYVNNVVEAIMENFFPQLAQDHYQTYKRVLSEPIILTGGMACIPGLKERIQQLLSRRAGAEGHRHLQRPPGPGASDRRLPHIRVHA